MTTAARTRTIVLLGKNGQVGQQLQRTLAPLGRLVAWGSAELNLHNQPMLRQRILQERPSLIVNAAAYTAVDRAESEPELARAINAQAVATLAQTSRDLDALLVHYSTDYVFDGSGTHARTETAATGPLNIYGQTKLEGEHHIQASGCRHLIFRTSWVYSRHGHNFIRTMLRLAQAKDTLHVVNDQIGAPTSAELIADITAHAIARTLAAPDPDSLTGLYHLSANGTTSWHGYATRILEQARAHKIPMRATPATIMPIATCHYPTPAVRPLNSRLDCSRIQQCFDVHLPHWESDFTRILEAMLTTSNPTSPIFP